MLRIKSLITLTLIILFSGFIFFAKTKIKKNSEIRPYQNGDMIFQTTIAGQGKAIQLATHSKYTHIGIIFKENNEWMVYEAVQPVQKISLKSFIERGDNKKYVIKRLANDSLLKTDSVITNMKNYLTAQLDKNYDMYFNWKDDELYCSELVWKCYQTIGIEIGKTKVLGDFDLSSPIVKTILNERYGDAIPLQEKVIAPSDIFDNKKLMLVEEK